MIVDLPLIGIACVALLYQLACRGMIGGRRLREGRQRAEAFYAGLAALLVATEPPLDGLADKLFWAHMLQHMLLQMVAPPLLVLGAPWLLIWRLFPLPSRRRLSPWLVHSRGASPLRLAARVLGLPAVAWLLFIGTIALSHLPRVFDLALRDTAFHEGEHALFLGLGLLFWSRALDSPPLRARLRPSRAVVFFLTAIAAESLLALVIMGADSPLYAPYARLAPRPEGLSALADQQFGGALMLEPASLPLLIALLWAIRCWLGQTDLKLPSRLRQLVRPEEDGGSWSPARAATARTEEARNRAGLHRAAASNPADGTAPVERIEGRPLERTLDGPS